MKLIEDKKLQENFWLNEFLSQSDPISINPQDAINVDRLSYKLQQLRDIVDSININSGWRSVPWNSRVRGSANSYHLKGLAADIKFDFSIWNRKSLERVLKFVGFTNVNFYWTADRKSWVWLHVDIGPTWNGLEFNYRDMDANTQKEIEV